MIDNKNIVLAVVLSIIILVGFDMFFSKDRPAPPPGDQPGTEQPAPGTTSTPTPSQAPGLPAPSTPGTAIPALPGAPGAAIPSAPGMASAEEWRSVRKTIIKKGSGSRSAPRACTAPST